MRPTLRLQRLFVLVPVALALALAACSSPAPEPTLYLLREPPMNGEGPVTGSPRVGLGRVVVAPYLLTSPGIVVETEPGVVRAGRFHQWAEPLDTGLRWYLRIAMARALGFAVGGGLTDVADWDYTVDLYVSLLHGTMQGEAVIAAAYVIRPANGEGRSEYRFARSQPLPEAGYPGVVAAEKALLTELGAAIAAGVKDAQAASSEAAPPAPAP
jgi:uncharacterized lipoprotein YmbA